MIDQALGRPTTALDEDCSGQDGAGSAVGFPSLRLEEQMMAAFMRANADGRADVAEHLLRALEAFCSGGPPASPSRAHPVFSPGIVPKRWN